MITTTTTATTSTTTVVEVVVVVSLRFVDTGQLKRAKNARPQFVGKHRTRREDDGRCFTFFFGYAERDRRRRRRRR